MDQSFYDQEMFYLSRRMFATDAARIFKDTYGRGGKWKNNTLWGTLPAEKNPQKIYIQLVALGESPDPDAVDQLVGDTSLTRLSCTLCDGDKEEILVVDSMCEECKNIRLCESCLVRMLATFRAQGKS